MCYYIETGDYMDNILDMKRNLVKKRNVINLLLFPCWILSFFVSIDAMVKVLPIVEFMTIVLKMDYLDRYFLLSVVEFFYRYFPTMIYISGRVYIFNLNKKIIKLEMENDFDLLLERERMATKMDECVVIDEKEVRKVYDIVERFANLPRSKQMEVLNYIKGDLSLKDKELCADINELSNQYRDTLQIECEDILFPDIEDDKNNYTKKREK